ncbi:hypothetical protein ACVNS2_11960 [Paenibacillus caseinilyticus]|uniref:Uncharacterized protein n=1 Tax=Paenibacillus mucilaginosus K02 TaxID=997761 RepID=I0BG48_9BACL|nr:hypothetical protein [Paenibacillus mucilaginosus]AFH61345.1 hypothetical protein B2K_11545 [Paenibacillus mucilaginosus K02]
MYSQVYMGRTDIKNNLTEAEVEELLSNQELEVIQFSAPLEPYTFQLLNDLFFKERDDVELRVYGFYDSRCDLSFLSALPNVTRFTVDCIREVDHLDAITHLDKLKALHIGIYHLDNLDILTRVPATLESMMLEQTQSKKPDLAVLERFSGLKKLYIEGHTKNIDVIGKLHQLEDVTLKSVTTNDVEFLAPLQKLWSLDIKLGGIQNFSAIEGMDSIKYLELWQIRGLKDLSFISTLTGLQYLFLQSHRNVESLPALNGLTKLRKVHLDLMKGLKDISSLGQAPSLAEFTHWSAMNMKMEDYTALLSNPSVQRVRATFDSAKRNNEFEAMVEHYGKTSEVLWREFPYE